jgi:hypothetical protein
MKLDEKRRSYSATLEFSPTHKVSVLIDWMGTAPAEALKQSQGVCERVRAREPEYRSRIARDLLRLYNENWRNGEELELLDEDGFMRRISLSGISIGAADFGSDGCVSLDYSAGDLFAGHAIEVNLDSDLQYVRSGIYG